MSRELHALQSYSPHQGWSKQPPRKIAKTMLANIGIMSETSSKKPFMSPAQSPGGKVQQDRLRMQNSHSLQESWRFISLRQDVGPKIEVRPLKHLLVVAFAAHPTGSMHKAHSVPPKYYARQ